MDANKLKYQLLLIAKRLQFGAKAQLLFLEDFYSLIVDGIPPNKAIAILLRSSDGVRHKVAASIADSIATGKPLAYGMKDWFIFNVVEMIRIGESGGVLAETVKSAMSLMSARGSMFASVIKSVMYPLVILMAGAIMLVYLKNKVFSEFMTIKPFDTWPSAGKNLVFIATFIESWWWFVLLVFIVSCMAIKIALQNYSGELRDRLDYFFPFNMYKRFVAAQLLETLGLLVTNGMVFKEALLIISQRVSPYLRMHLGRMEQLMSKGQGNIADVMNTGLIAEQDLIRMRILAEVKGFEQGLAALGAKGTAQASDVIKAMARIVAGILLAVGGFLIMLAINGIYQTGMFLGQQ